MPQTTSREGRTMPENTEQQLLTRDEWTNLIIGTGDALVGEMAEAILAYYAAPGPGAYPVLCAVAEKLHAITGDAP